MNTDNAEASSGDLEREFEAALQKEGLQVSPERIAGLLSTYEDLKLQMATIRGNLTVADEPTSIFRLSRINGND